MPRVGGYATRNRIVLEAMRLFHNRGYHAVGLHEVIKRCGASKGVFYFHFKSKDDLAAAVLDMNIVTVPSVVKVCFSGRTWADGVDTWIKSLAGATEEPAALAVPIFGLALQLSSLSPAFSHRAMWTIKSFERAIYAELEARGWGREAASRRSATFSALVIGHLIRHAYTGSDNVLADLRRDLESVAGPPGSRSSDGVRAPMSPVAYGRRKNREKPLDSVDKRSIMCSLRPTNADDPSGLRRQKLLEKLAAVFWRRGYYNTSLNDIASACAVPKGSLNKLFGDKRAMALEAMGRYRRSGEALLERVFSAPTWRAATSELVGSIKLSGLSQYVCGCPLANMGLELAADDDQMRRCAVAMLEAAAGRFEKALEAYGGGRSGAAALAASAVAILEGHLTRMSLYADLGNADEAREDLLALVTGL